MQGPKYQMTCFCRCQGKTDRLNITHLANKHHVRIFAQSRSQSIIKTLRMPADLALVHKAIMALMYKFDRVFNRQNMALFVVIDVINHCSKGGGFTGAGWSCDQNQTTMQV